ncbi:AzlC family ABC transporter permease [Oceanobacillus sp. FSL W8-0428]|uniref:Branched-chain amino acid transport protein AzlC n=1 Tax=Oceanobacillus sojae TaxID=582851 RepID=A0A511ZMA8_9BACI|nr:AzlC family ABC transporter permease [Oceanobacillus sojae]GEN88567.1 branched-chain amino acid transport protein AzlC [Oceanobacillus sojae]
MSLENHLSTLKYAFPKTLPILAGFAFLGIAYGVYMHSLGFQPIYAILMSILIFAGSMEFVAGSLLLGAFNPLSAFLLTLMINARHLFYGISMLDKYKGTGKKKIYLIYGMCDESFVINNTSRIPSNIDKGWFMFYVTLLNQIYWVSGATIGSLFGSMITFNTEGLEFVMTALFVVIFLDQWLKERNHISSVIGIAASVLCLILFGTEHFIIPAMLIILIFLTLIKKFITKHEVIS